ncbi:hypothetical protein [Agromyces humi]|uniref:hypothetical protein n=1 Tax=Agromyces humi TaxID=1766800 RepID=UPI001358FC09|nr:hypothetical protein [Agromyces humi]
MTVTVGVAIALVEGALNDELELALSKALEVFPAAEVVESCFLFSANVAMNADESAAYGSNPAPVSLTLNAMARGQGWTPAHPDPRYVDAARSSFRQVGRAVLDRVFSLSTGRSVPSGTIRLSLGWHNASAAGAAWFALEMLLSQAVTVNRPATEVLAEYRSWLTRELGEPPGT